MASPLEFYRQTGWDLWVVVCVIATLTLISYAAIARLWRSLRGWVGLGLIAVGTAGTFLVLVLKSLHTPLVGLVWTFVILAILSIVFYLNLLPQLRGRRMSVLLSMRLVALGLMVLMLFEPGCRYVTGPKPTRPLLFVIDKSGSMSFPDVQNGPTRTQAVWQALRPHLQRLGEHFVLSFHTFDTELHELEKPEELASLVADGKATDILKAARNARYKTNKEGSSIVLVSDGIDNVSQSSQEVVNGLANLGWKIHTVRVGSEQTQPATLANIAVESVVCPDELVVRQEAKIKVNVTSTALANRVVEVKLAEVDAKGNPTEPARVANLVLQPVAEGQTVEIGYTPKSAGLRRLAAWVDPLTTERSHADNRQEFQALATDPRIKVLYIEGTVRSEYGYLKDALARDGNIEVATMLQVQIGQWRAGGTVDGEEFKEMPQAADQWRNFDVVILGDVSATTLGKLQPGAADAIRQFVEAGGGLLMLGGQESFGPGGWAQTPVEQVLPVFVGGTSSTQEKQEFVPRLTKLGAEHPAMEGLAAWFGVDDKKGEQTSELETRPLRGNVVVEKARQGAQVLLYHPSAKGPDGNPQVILAVQIVGGGGGAPEARVGRSAAFTADTTWRWYLGLRRMGQDSPYNRFWGQVVRWLAGGDVRTRQRGAGIVGLLNKSVYQVGESVRVRAMVRDLRGDATDHATVTLTLRKAGQKDEVVNLELTNRKGVYETTLDGRNLSKGDYTIELSASKEKDALGKQELKFTVLPPAEEMIKIAANPKLLGAIAAATAGENVELSELKSLVDRLVENLLAEDRDAPKPREEIVPLSNVVAAAGDLVGMRPDWPDYVHLPMQAGLIFVLLAGEWILRRRWHLP